LSKICEPVVKYAKLVYRSEEINIWSLKKLLSIAKSGRPGPVLSAIYLSMFEKSQINPEERIGYDETLNLSYNEARLSKQIDKLYC